MGDEVPRRKVRGIEAHLKSADFLISSVVKDFLADEFGLNRVWSLRFHKINGHQDHNWQ